MFWHKAVMEALVCGNTEISPHDLLIRMNKLARVHKSSKQTGYADEFKVAVPSNVCFPGQACLQDGLETTSK